MHKITFFILFTIFSNILMAQTGTINGRITNSENEALIGATISIGTTGTISDIDGNFELQTKLGKQQIVFSYIGYKSKSLDIEIKTTNDFITISLEEDVSVLQTATLTAGKYEKPLSEVTVSIDILKPNFIEQNNATSVDDILVKVPGVDIIDGQVNIRGGSGFSYGAGSRVLLLIDDIPALQADAGFPNWNDIPVENTRQLEIVKGAASALYGSSAMNGIINLRTTYPTAKPETTISSFYTIFDKPKIKENAWWETSPFEVGFNFNHKRKIKKLDMIVGTYLLNRKSFNKDVVTKYGRGYTNLRYHFTDKLSVGVNANFNKGFNKYFFFWKGLDSLQYIGNETSYNEGDYTRYYVDPFLTYFDKNDNRHKILTRFTSTDNVSIDEDKSNNSKLYYLEYQFQRKFNSNLVLTAGLVHIGSTVSADLYSKSDFKSRNYAVYTQIDKKFFDKLNLSFGGRYEINELFRPEIIANDTLVGGKEAGAKPVFRIGANYQLFDFTYLRASWGQGYRYPTIAEKFISTIAGGIPIIPNPNLTSETGISAEVGIKQGIQLGDWNGFVDVSGFLMDYENMMEFVLNTRNFGFQSKNVGGVIIKGIETTLAGQGKLWGFPLEALIGYTYLDPKYKEYNRDSIQTGKANNQAQYNALFSTADHNILKYRFQHTFKLDLQSNFEKFNIGISAAHYSYMEAVDVIFNIFIPNFKEYNEQHQKPINVFDLRMAYHFTKNIDANLIIKNILNEAYIFRPGLMEAPRSFTFKVGIRF